MIPLEEGGGDIFEWKRVKQFCMEVRGTKILHKGGKKHYKLVIFVSRMMLMLKRRRISANMTLLQEKHASSPQELEFSWPLGP